MIVKEWYSVTPAVGYRMNHPKSLVVQKYHLRTVQLSHEVSLGLFLPHFDKKWGLHSDRNYHSSVVKLKRVTP